MMASLSTPSFRDPAGSLLLEEDRAVRRIHPSARAATLAFIGSTFYQSAVESGDMVASEIEENADGLSLIHPLIDIPTYPWEWTPSQWLAAATLTIKLCQQSLEDGWILKDATPLNILFVGSRPVLVDVLSFIRRDQNSPIWLAHGQFIRTFLLPLIMFRLVGWPLELALFKRDGYEPHEIYRSLNWSQRLSQSAFWPISMPTWFDRKPSPTSLTQVNYRPDSETAQHILNRTLVNLLKRTNRVVRHVPASKWSNYQTTLTHYTSEQSEQKRLWVQQALEEFHPTSVLDIGANTGEYSRLAANSGAQVVALERDTTAADRLYLSSSVAGLQIQTIQADLARPTPPVGWETSEYAGLLPRLEGNFHLVMMLAVIHHLILMEQIPLPAILALCHRLTRRQLMIEWVPAADPMYVSLMRGRDDLYGALTDADLLSASESYFRAIRREVLGNGRILFLFEKL